MRLEDQVCSLDLARRLKELGVKQESLFYYQGIETEPEHGYVIRYFTATFDDEGNWKVSAFTVAELGEMLPTMFDIERTAHQLITNKGLLGRVWYVSATNLMNDTKNISHSEEADTEADARAKMLIYLLENKLITV